MKLLAHGFSTAETTVVTSTVATGHGGVAASTGSNLTYSEMTIERVVVVCGGTTVAANSSGGIKLSYGDSSAVFYSTLVFPTPYGGGMTSAATPPGATGPMVITLDDLNLRCRAFKVITNEAAHGGWSAFVYGK